jgi:transcriptional regulator with XRE-family HTH domain
VSIKPGRATVLGCNVARLRKAKNWTPAELAMRAGISPGYLGWIERGLRDGSTAVQEQIARALGATAGELHAVYDPRAAPQVPRGAVAPARRKPAARVPRAPAAAQAAAIAPPASDARADFYAKVDGLKRAAARASRQPGADPAAVYAGLASRVNELTATVQAGCAPRG